MKLTKTLIALIEDAMDYAPNDDHYERLARIRKLVDQIVIEEERLLNLNELLRGDVHALASDNRSLKEENLQLARRLARIDGKLQGWKTIDVE